MQDTRTRILELLRKGGEQTTGELAEALKLTRAAIASQLAALRAEGFITRTTFRRGRRRPSALYRLTPVANAFFPQGYEDFASLALDELKRAGTETLPGLLRRVGDRWIARDLPLLEGLSNEARLQRVERILAERGFMPEFRRDEERTILHEYNCPLSSLVPIHPGVCDMVHRWLQTLLDAPVTRTRCMRDGDPFSAYQFKRKSE